MRSHPTLLLRCVLACLALLGATDTSSAQFNFGPRPNANRTTTGAQFYQAYRQQLTDFWKKHSVPDPDATDATDKKPAADKKAADKTTPADKKDAPRIMGYAEAFKAFGLTAPNKPWVDPIDAAKADKQDEADKKETSSEADKPAPAKPAATARKPRKPERIDVQFIDAADKNRDHKVTEPEFNDFADRYAKKQADEHAAEINAERKREEEMKKAEAEIKKREEEMKKRMQAGKPRGR